MEPAHPFFAGAAALGRPLVLGHRGDSAHFAENTLSAFAAARAAGADGVELDVHACATGEVVVFHDPDLARMAGRGERIATLPWSELARVTVGRGERIPTLVQVLAAFDPDFRVNIEIKSPQLGRSGALVDRVLGCIAQESARGRERLLISSFDPFVIGRVRRLAPDLATGFLFHGEEPRVLQRAWRAPALRPHALHPDHVLIDDAAMSAWTEAGLSVAAWTVDRAHELRRLAALGVAAVIANDPGHALAVLTRP